jgi:uncharacterized membrane protein (DUF2068 family)
MGDLEKDIAALVECKARRRVCELLHGIAAMVASENVDLDVVKHLLKCDADPRDTRHHILSQAELHTLRAVVNALEGK